MHFLCAEPWALQGPWTMAYTRDQEQKKLSWDRVSTMNDLRQLAECILQEALAARVLYLGVGRSPLPLLEILSGKGALCRSVPFSLRREERVREINQWHESFDRLLAGYDAELGSLLKDVERISLVDYCDSGMTLLFAGKALSLWLQKQGSTTEVELLALLKDRQSLLMLEHETLLQVRPYSLERFGSLGEAFHCEFFDWGQGLS